MNQPHEVCKAAAYRSRGWRSGPAIVDFKDRQSSNAYRDFHGTLMNMPSGIPNLRLGVICCSHVFRRERDVRYTLHEPDGWQFMCGEKDHYSSADGHFVHVGGLLQFDPTLHEISDLPAGCKAERMDGASPWVRSP